ncbi:hypothetical protein [Streptomyces sp. NPDC048436]|uniref:hypothetical protein n=1 Tax=Streptomyces sp. NPDC048436 TaxID=3365550 RepID=UPI00371711DC
MTRGPLPGAPRNKRFDTVLMGRGTYEAGLPQGSIRPYARMERYVVSSTLAGLDPVDMRS